MEEGEKQVSSRFIESAQLAQHAQATQSRQEVTRKPSPPPPEARGHPRGGQASTYLSRVRSGVNAKHAAAAKHNQTTQCF